MENKLFNITKIDDQKTRIEIDGTIGGFDFEEWKEYNTGKDIRKQLAQIENIETAEIEVLITSQGGSIEQAMQIYDALKSCKAKITTIVQGFCASAATVIACAGEERIISPNALYLIHKCWGNYMKANENTLVEELETQRKVNETILNIYKTVLNKSEQELNKLFEANNGNGKWITADEALEFGFATKIQEMEFKSPNNNAIAKLLNHARNFTENTNIENRLEEIQNEEKLEMQIVNMEIDIENLQNKNKELENKLLILEEERKELVFNLSENKTALSKAEELIEEKDLLINSLTEERDSYKEKYESKPATITLSNSSDEKEISNFRSKMYEELEKYL